MRVIRPIQARYSQSRVMEETSEDQARIRRNHSAFDRVGSLTRSAPRHFACEPVHHRYTSLSGVAKAPRSRTRRSVMLKTVDVLMLDAREISLNECGDEQ